MPYRHEPYKNQKRQALKLYYTRYFNEHGLSALRAHLDSQKDRHQISWDDWWYFKRGSFSTAYGFQPSTGSFDDQQSDQYKRPKRNVKRWENRAFYEAKEVIPVMKTIVKKPLPMIPAAQKFVDLNLEEAEMEVLNNIDTMNALPKGDLIKLNLVLLERLLTEINNYKKVQKELEKCKAELLNLKYAKPKSILFKRP